MHNCHKLFSMNNCHYAVSNTVLLILDTLYSIAHVLHSNYLNFIDGSFSYSLGSLLPSNIGYEILLVT